MKAVSKFLIALLALCALVAGCSSATDDTSTDGDAAYTPVTVHHQYGDTVIDKKPTRVITLLGNWTDTLVALGVPITAEYVPMGFGGAGDRFAWTPEHSSEVHAVGNILQLDVEELAKYQPDLILAGYVGDQANYDKLSKLAPTIPAIATDSVMDTWEQVTTTAGEIFGAQDKAKSLVDGVNDKIAQFKKDYPATEGKTADFAQVMGSQVNVIASATDPATRLLGQLGFGLSAGVKAMPVSGSGRIPVSAERIGDLNGDLMVAWPVGGGPEAFDRVPGWNALPSVQAGATLYLNNDNAAAFSYPSVYSVPFAIDLLGPAAAKVQ